MSTTLSTISRQWALGMSRTFQVQPVHSSEATSGISGIICSAIGGLPSTSCHTKSWPLRSIAVQVRVRARSGMRLA